MLCIMSESTVLVLYLCCVQHQQTLFLHVNHGHVPTRPSSPTHLPTPGNNPPSGAADWLSNLTTIAGIAAAASQLAPFSGIKTVIDGVTSLLGVIDVSFSTELPSLMAGSISRKQKDRRNKDNLKDLAKCVFLIIQFVHDEIVAHGPKSASRVMDLVKDFTRWESNRKLDAVC